VRQGGTSTSIRREDIVKLKEAVRGDLAAAGVPQDAIEKAVASIERNFPTKTYLLAVWFLGIVTMILVVGGVASGLLGKTVPDALWAALGAGIGALAGIFTGKGGS
jgi:hypothetical protein